ncbi:hypothetical protein [Bacillus sp. FJAT-45350]|uniref:hypothetical protein n=1 Tax=Bacillus sp. FJAT-45350 TaxID=2011014 RepID=UPI000BB920AB|nr:hypothetical protein [Bacillus sp. FJAT-45350]
MKKIVTVGLLTGLLFTGTTGTYGNEGNNGNGNGNAFAYGHKHAYGQLKKVEHELTVEYISTWYESNGFTFNPEFSIYGYDGIAEEHYPNSNQKMIAVRMIPDAELEAVTAGLEEISQVADYSQITVSYELGVGNIVRIFWLDTHFTKVVDEQTNMDAIMRLMWGYTSVTGFEYFTTLGYYEGNGVYRVGFRRSGIDSIAALEQQAMIDFISKTFNAKIIEDYIVKDEHPGNSYNIIRFTLE